MPLFKLLGYFYIKGENVPWDICYHLHKQHYRNFDVPPKWQNEIRFNLVTKNTACASSWRTGVKTVFYDFSILCA
jgi:hypothetical protein